jgi:hypothetical protein
MHTWRITWRIESTHRRLLADVDADELMVENRGTHLVLSRWQMIGLNVQRVIVWRLGANEATVESLCSSPLPDPRCCDDPCAPDGFAPARDSRPRT